MSHAEILVETGREAVNEPLYMISAGLDHSANRGTYIYYHRRTFWAFDIHGNQGNLGTGAPLQKRLEETAMTGLAFAARISSDALRWGNVPQGRERGMKWHIRDLRW